jgi:hypothetical protein
MSYIVILMIFIAIFPTIGYGSSLCTKMKRYFSLTRSNWSDRDRNVKRNRKCLDFGLKIWIKLKRGLFGQTFEKVGPDLSINRETKILV